MNFRIVKDKLLYIIGIPKKFASEEILRSEVFCRQFGYPEKIVINPRDNTSMAWLLNIDLL